MLKLVSEGIMAPVPRGFQFIALSDTDLAELDWIRALLEPPAVRLAAELATDEQLQPFASQIDDMTAAAERRDIPSFFELDRNFHLGLVHLSGRKHLATIIEQLRDKTWRYHVTATMPQDTVRHLLSEHRKLLMHIQQGEGESAATLLRDHILG
jgi:DNA-binding GntR family transcriptional regulator